MDPIKCLQKMATQTYVQSTTVESQLHLRSLTMHNQTQITMHKLTRKYLDPDDFLADAQRMPVWFVDALNDPANLIGAHGHVRLRNRANVKIPAQVKLDVPFVWAAHLAAEYASTQCGVNVGRAKCTIQLPACFGKKILNDLQASAMNVDLNFWNPYFCRLGGKICKVYVSTFHAPSYFLHQVTFCTKLLFAPSHLQTLANTCKHLQQVTCKQVNSKHIQQGVLTRRIQTDNDLPNVLASSLVRRALLITDFAQSSVFGGSVGDLSQDQFVRSLDESEQKLFALALASAANVKAWEQVEQ